MQVPSKTPARSVQLPAQLTSFIGRTNEINEITGLLLDPGCRLLTLVGPGGVGKTRLAIQATAKMADNFADGIFFVALQAVHSIDFLIPAIADALHLPLTGQIDPISQLLRYLYGRKLLLLLDNFEQLLSSPGEGAIGCETLLATLLENTPFVKLLVTSREVLNLQGEWLYQLQGLAFPLERDTVLSEVEAVGGEARPYEAIELFIERARRMRQDFSLMTEQAEVIRLCQLVEGIPLALELAASWVKTLSCAEVADEIQRNLDFLTISSRNVPERHRSMLAVFDHSWQRLAPEEQGTLMQLSVFRGGFLRVAAEVVAGASLPLLTSLVDKSLLRWEPDRHRYQVHELLRQFGEEQLAQAPETIVHLRDLHARYYTRFLGDRFNDLTGERQGRVLAEVRAEIDNIRTAWQWAVSRGYSGDLAYAAMGLHTFYQYQGHFVEGTEVFAAAVNAVESMPPSPERDRELAVLLNCAGWLEMRLGRVPEATQMQKKALSLYESLNLLPTPGQGTDPLTALTLLAMTRGDYDHAMTLGHQAWQRAVARSDQKNMAMAGYGLTNGMMAQGNYETALHYAQETLALTKLAGNRWLMAYIYSQLGRINQTLGNLDTASDYYQTSYTLKEALNDPEGMALALTYLGEIALARGVGQQAHDLYHQSLILYQEIGDRGGIVRALHGLGMAAHSQGNEPTARDYLQQALQAALAVQVIPLILSVLAGIGAYFIENGNRERGVALLAFIQHHPVSDQMMKVKVSQLLVAHQAVIIAEAEAHGMELDILVTTLLAELSTPVTLAGDLTVPVHQPDPVTAYPLIDLLSERELEVLRLIADGLTNRQIAERLFVALGTIKAHTSNIYSKLGVSNRTQAVTRAQELKLL